MPPSEVRPEDVSHVELGVGNLPQKEVAYSHLTARSYEEIRIRKIRTVQILLEGNESNIYQLNIINTILRVPSMRDAECVMRFQF